MEQKSSTQSDTAVGLGERARVLPLTLSILAAIYSWFISGGGIQPLLPKLPIWISWTIALGISAIISVAIFAFWRAVILNQATGYTERALFLICGLISSLLSAAVASGFASYALNHQHYQKAAVAKPLEQMLSPVSGVSKAASQNSARLQHLADRMVYLGEREAVYGDTCADSTPQKTCGPRCRMRKKIAENASQHAKSAAEVALEARKLAALSGNIDNAKDWGTLYSRVLALANDTRIYSISLWADKLVRNFDKGFREGSNEFTCSDPETSFELAAISKDLQKTVALPDAAPTWTDADGAYAIRKNLQTLKETVAYSLNLTSSFDRKAMSTMAIPLGFSILIEIFTVACLALALPSTLRMKTHPRWASFKTNKDPRQQHISLDDLVTSEEQRPNLVRLATAYLSAILVQRQDKRGRRKFAIYLLVPMTFPLRGTKLLSDC